MSNQDVITLLVAALPVVAPFLGALYQLLVSRLPVNHQGQMKSVIASAVSAAEKVYTGIPGSGQAKRQYVVSRVEAIFGKKLNPALVEVLLEEAVSLLPASPVAANPSPAKAPASLV